ncbi:sulfatase [Labilibacter sediminis]|nr:sulfatase [Labilibacter sediminis]
MICTNALSQTSRPNIIFIMSDDHATSAISAYGSHLTEVFKTPNIDRLANEGVKLENCFVTNAICTPSRATILTGKYSHKNGVYTLLGKIRDQENVASVLQQNDYMTTVIGKWHLHTEPYGFDDFDVLPGQGKYYNPKFKNKAKLKRSFKLDRGEQYEGYSTDIIGDKAVNWMKNRAADKPFFLMCHFKAPHRPWDPAPRYKDFLKDVKVPEPFNLHDDNSGQGKWAQSAFNKIGKDMQAFDIGTEIPEGLTGEELTSFKYQHFIKRYLACCKAVDDNVGKLLEYLDESGLAKNTIIIYTSDQGFFLGEHGWYDKRLIYEEGLRMPFVVRYPNVIMANKEVKNLVVNTDFAPTFLDFAGVDIPEDMQGVSLKPILISKKKIKDWRKSVYYRYWMHMTDVGVPAHYGIRTERYKLTYYYGLPLGMRGTARRIDLYNKESGMIKPTPSEWEFFDLKKDPFEMNNLYGNPKYDKVIDELKEQLKTQKNSLGDSDETYPELQKQTAKDW